MKDKINILSLDLSTNFCAVSLLKSGKIYSEPAEEINSAKKHTKIIMSLIDNLLLKAKCGKSDLDLIAFGAGPGSFTGVRLCASIAQGLAFGLGISIVPVSTLQAIAMSILDSCNQGSYILSTIDARMGEIYWGLYKKISDNKVELALPDILSESVSTIEKAQVLLRKNGIALADVYITGTALDNEKYNKKIKGIGENSSIVPITNIIHHKSNNKFNFADFIIDIAIENYKKGTIIGTNEIGIAQPVYIRNNVTS